MNLEDVESERWDEWAHRMQDLPESGVRQLMDVGLGQDTAFLLVMLGQLHSELLAIESLIARRPDDEDWKP